MAKMKISTKGRYALRMLLDLAAHQEEGFIALKDIAQRQNISKKYLEQIVPLLAHAGFLQASRGFQGGYRLSKSPEEYNVCSILCITEGGLAPVACLDDAENACTRNCDCMTLPVWQGLDRVIHSYLESITLQDILSGRVCAKADSPK